MYIEHKSIILAECSKKESEQYFNTKFIYSLFKKSQTSVASLYKIES